MTAERILLLGGTALGRKLAARLARRHTLIYSLAGITDAPRLPLGVTLRSGGVGGSDGLADYLREQRISLLIDATHPHAQRISHNARLACAQSGTRYRQRRPKPWQAAAGDRWQHCADLHAASAWLSAQPAQRVFLAIGQHWAETLSTAEQHDYLLRTINPIDFQRDNLRLIRARGPFTLADEIALLRDQRIQLLVCKNRGGTVGCEKLLAARALAIPVLLIEALRGAGQGED